MVNDKINQILKDRKAQKKKIGKYRKSRIFKRFNQDKPLYQQQFDEKVLTNPIDIKKKQFYDNLFAQKEEEVVKQNEHNIVEEQNHEQNTLYRFQNQKKKYIKKMQTQKTSKGQPLMRNYVKYALTKLEETLFKEKKQKQGKV